MVIFNSYVSLLEGNLKLAEPCSHFFSGSQILTILPMIRSGQLILGYVRKKSDSYGDHETTN